MIIAEHMAKSGACAALVASHIAQTLIYSISNVFLAVFLLLLVYIMAPKKKMGTKKGLSKKVFERLVVPTETDTES